jgi:nucleotide-binding universal stress UspA family protein
MQEPILTRHLLLAVDGSEHAKAASQFVLDLPLPTECHISVISVLIPRNVQQHKIIENILEHTGTLLQEKITKPIRTELITGYPAEEIISYADAHKPDLIVLGARGLRSTLGIFLGGVAQNVVEYACCPVLVVRSPYTGLRNILLATDGSQYSQLALQYLQHCPLPEGVEKQVIHVIPPEITAEAFGASWQLNMELTAPILTEQMQIQLMNKAIEEEENGQSLLKKSIRDLEILGITATGILRRGDAATEIIDYARDENIDLIVVGSRGLSTFRSWFLGSVSRKLVHYADCSVLIVKDPSQRRIP